MPRGILKLTHLNLLIEHLAKNNRRLPFNLDSSSVVMSLIGQLAGIRSLFVSFWFPEASRYPEKTNQHISASLMFLEVA